MRSLTVGSLDARRHQLFMVPGAAPDPDEEVLLETADGDEQRRGRVCGWRHDNARPQGVIVTVVQVPDGG